MKNSPIPLDTILPQGKVAAVGSLGGERYYWTVDVHGSVGMFPATAVEDQAPTNSSSSPKKPPVTLAEMEKKQ